MSERICENFIGRNLLVESKLNVAISTLLQIWLSPDDEFDYLLTLQPSPHSVMQLFQVIL